MGRGVVTIGLGFDGGVDPEAVKAEGRGARGLFCEVDKTGPLGCWMLRLRFSLMLLREEPPSPCGVSSLAFVRPMIVSEGRSIILVRSI